jgi:Ca2+-binding EF-hand superfamily protein
MPTQKQQYLRSIFQRMDKNGSGTVEREEFRIAMQSISPNLSLPDIDLLFDTVDQDGNNRIGTLTHLLTHSLTHSLTYSLTHLLTHSLTYLLTHLLTHSTTHSLT